MNTVEQVLDNYLELAAKAGRTTMEVLDHLLEQERKYREAAAIERRTKFAVYTIRKTLKEFDFEF